MIPLGVKKKFVKNAGPVFIGKSVGTAKRDTVTMIAGKILVVVLILNPM